MKNIKYISIILLIINISFGYRDTPDIVTKVATSVGNWLKLETDARAVGMGGAQVAAGEGVSALSYNPASIGFMQGSQLYYSKTNYVADITHSSMAYGTQLTPTDFFAIHYFAMNSGEMEITTAKYPDGNIGFFDVTGMSFRGTYAKILTDRLKVGVSFKYIQEDIHTTKMNTVAMDIGSNFDTGIYGLILGMSITNFGLDGQFHGEGLDIPVPDTLSVDETLQKVTQKFPLPMAFRLGIKKTIIIGGNIGDGVSIPGEGVSTPIHKIIFAFDGTNPIDYTVTGNLGMEYSWRELAFLRLGTHIGHDTASYTAGAGVKIGNIHIDYAWASYSILADTHQFGLRFGF